MLLFKNKFISAIRSGEKTQTIRFWDRRRMREGQRSYIPGIGYIIISEVQEIALAELTDADAVPDGFVTADALRKELNELYADSQRQGLRPFRIRFSVYSPAEQLRIKEEKAAEKAKACILSFENRQRKSGEQVGRALNKLKRLAAG